MDYEKLYKEALERATKLAFTGNISATAAGEIFHELRESEDEIIRKEITNYFKCQSRDEPTRKDIHNKWITWLDKVIIPSHNDTDSSFIEDIKNVITEAPLLMQSDKEKMITWLEKQGEERKITHEEICKSYGIPDIGEFSDGYHTFNGLYKQRMILFAVLVKTYKDRAWKSWKHEDGLDCFGGGWFIVGIDTPAGTYTYHYEAKDWDRFDCQILEKAKHWDGHDEFDVERLFSLVSNANKDEVIRCLINGMKFYYENNKEATWGTDKWSMPVKHIIEVLEKQGEQKPVDKVEPKFKVGDWVASNICNSSDLLRIIDVDGKDYEVETPQGNTGVPSIAYVDSNFHLWTIQDAKDGDVLYDSYTNTILIFKSQTCGWIKVYCDFWINKNKFTGTDPADYGRLSEMKLIPATKEQCVLLFAKMKEADYEWDAEKKELKKIEQKPVWSEEDEERLNSCIFCTQSFAVENHVDSANTAWLKSIKQRIQKGE